MVAPRHAGAGVGAPPQPAANYQLASHPPTRMLARSHSLSSPQCATSVEGSPQHHSNFGVRARAHLGASICLLALAMAPLADQQQFSIAVNTAWEAFSIAQFF